MAKQKPSETAETLKARIRAHHAGDPRLSAPEWAVMTEVASQTGGASRYADAIAMNLWPSRGLAIHGFEVKVYRGDWLRELRDPGKAEAIHRYCDYWWIVAPEGVVVDGELPDGWGLYVPNGGAKLRIVTKAAKASAPADVGRAFLAAMLRRSVQQSPDKRAIEAAVLEERRRLTEIHKESAAIDRRERQALDDVLSVINQAAIVAGRRVGLSRYTSREDLVEVGRLLALGSEPATLVMRVEALTSHLLTSVDRLVVEAERLRAGAGLDPVERGPT